MILSQEMLKSYQLVCGLKIDCMKMFTLREVLSRRIFFACNNCNEGKLACRHPMTKAQHVCAHRIDFTEWASTLRSPIAIGFHAIIEYTIPIKNVSLDF